ncbi:unnamed protein product [Miscanthus lutarioriparius]|uniref:Uncharacterized protein n=1 Tax=Miscanthus lutarioriparius TaxID=422564 RepID=A0A811P7J8_9POAL|nr:unnamed protein product [Miscanthus lutarioriparius]
MSSEPRARTPTAAEELVADLASAAAHPTPSKKQLKKDARRAEKAAAAQRQRQQHVHAQAEAKQAEDFLAGNYGDVPAEETQSKAVTDRSWTRVRDLGAAELRDRSVLVLGFVQSTRSFSRMTFLVLR